jgi:Transcriptional regulator, AbiEi antitoxin
VAVVGGSGPLAAASLCIERTPVDESHDGVDPTAFSMLDSVSSPAGPAKPAAGSIMDPRLAAVALSQAGVFRTAQARVAGGYSPDEIRARVLRGSWVRLRRGVLATAGTVAAARATSDGSFVISVAAEICARSGLIVASPWSPPRVPVRRSNGLAASQEYP